MEAWLSLLSCVILTSRVLTGDQNNMKLHQLTVSRLV